MDEIKLSSPELMAISDLLRSRRDGGYRLIWHCEQLGVSLERCKVLLAVLNLHHDDCPGCELCDTLSEYRARK